MKKSFIFCMLIVIVLYNISVSANNAGNNSIEKAEVEDAESIKEEIQVKLDKNLVGTWYVDGDPEHYFTIRTNGRILEVNLDLGTVDEYSLEFAEDHFWLIDMRTHTAYFIVNFSDGIIHLSHRSASFGYSGSDYILQKSIRNDDNSSEISSDEVLYDDEWTWRYRISDDNTATIVGYNGDDEAGEINIPEEIDGHTVTEIGGIDTYKGYSSIQSEDSSRVFSRYSGSVYFPKTINSIVDNPFDGNQNIIIIDPDNQSLTFDGNILVCDKKLVSYAPHKDSSVYDIPDGITIIGKHAFSGSNLTEVHIPASVKKIESEAFADSNIQKIVIAEGLECLSYKAFYSCSDLVSINIPASVTEISGNPFGSCYSLTDLIISSANTRYCLDENTLIDRDSKGIIAYIDTSDEDLSLSYAVPDGIEYIADGAFSDCDDFSEILLPDSLKEIGDNAFRRVTLNSIFIPDGVSTIGEKAFRYCHFEEIHLPASLKIIEPGTFAGASIPQISIPEGVTIIGEDAFNNSKINRITIPDSVTEIGDRAFSYINYDPWDQDEYGYLEDLKLPAGLTSISAGLFDSANIDHVIIPNGVTEIGEGAFSRSMIVDIEIPSSVTKIGESAFEKCWDLESVSGLSSVDIIPNRAFAYCSSLNDFEYSEGLLVIGEEAFRSCPISSISMPSSLVAIERGSFSECSNLTTIMLNDGLRSIGYNAFLNCPASRIDLPDSVIIIGDAAFQGCSNLSEIMIPSETKYIKQNPFIDCSSLKKIVVSDKNDAFEVIDGALYDKVNDLMVTEPINTDTYNESSAYDDFSNTLYLQSVDENTFEVLDAGAQNNSDKILVRDDADDNYYDEDTDCYVWYNEDFAVWQYWYEGISSDYDDYGWMEYNEQENKWYIEANYDQWIKLPEQYDVSILWHIR